MQFSNSNNLANGGAAWLVQAANTIDVRGQRWSIASSGWSLTGLGGGTTIVIGGASVAQCRTYRYFGKSISQQVSRFIMNEVGGLNEVVL